MKTKTYNPVDPAEVLAEELAEGSAYTIIHTADNEEPDCMHCNNVCGDEDACCRCCGPEHGWSLYKRTEIIRRLQQSKNTARGGE